MNLVKSAPSLCPLDAPHGRLV